MSMTAGIERPIRSLRGGMVLLLVVTFSLLACETMASVNLETIRADRRDGYSSIVFQFSNDVEVEPPVTKAGALQLALHNVSTELPYEHHYSDLGSWLRLEDNDSDIIVKIGLPPEFDRVRYFELEDPSRLVLNLYDNSGESTPIAANQETASTEPSTHSGEVTPPDTAVEPLAPGPTPRQSQAAAVKELMDEPRLTLTLRDLPISEAFEMLARRGKINLILGKGVSGNVSLNLYGLTIEEAIYAIAEAAGYGVARRHRGYVILPADKIEQVGDDMADTEVRTFKVQYSDPELVEGILRKYLSSHGKLTVLEERRLLVAEDNPVSLNRMTDLLEQIDRVPRQVLIEAKILEVTLDDSESLGLDWAKLFNAEGGQGSFGLQGFANDKATGFVATLADSSRINFVLNYLNEEGKLRTLSTPRLRALENQQAIVHIGDRQGYRVTTTINQVTTESIEFLESGVILRVTPSVDDENRVMMLIHPEISTGSIQDGIPAQNTTEVNTSLLAENGQPIFIGGLIKNQTSFTRSGIPVLGKLPVLGLLFSSKEDVVSYTETVVVITPHLVSDIADEFSNGTTSKVRTIQSEIEADMQRELPQDSVINPYGSPLDRDP